MEKMTKTYARIINDVIMSEEERPSITVMPARKTIVTSGGKLKEAGWMVSTVVVANKNSFSFSVQLPGGRSGYTTDILNRFLDEEVVREYAENALARVLELNNWQAAVVA